MGIESIMAVARPVTRLRRAGTAGGDARRRPCRWRGHSRRPCGAALLVAGDNEPDRGVIEPVEQGQHHAAQIAEHGVDAEVQKGIDDDLGAGSGRGVYRLRRPVSTSMAFLFLF